MKTKYTEKIKKNLNLLKNIRHDVVYRVSMSLFCLSHYLVYLLYFCPRCMGQKLGQKYNR